MQYVVPVDDRDRGQRPHGLSQVVLQQHPADEDPGSAGGAAGERAAADDVPELLPAVGEDRPGGDEVARQVGEQLVEDLLAAREQRVGLAGLRDPPAVHRTAREHVALDDCDAGERLGQYAGGEQPGHAGAEYDGVLADGIRGHR